MENFKKINHLLFLVAVFSLLTKTQVSGQIIDSILTIKYNCNFHSTSIIYSFKYSEPAPEMVRIYNDLLSVYGKKRIGILLRESNDASNAMATMHRGNRYILYNESFLNEIQNSSLTGWSARFILAHEIGHHVLQHEFGSKTKKQSHIDELDADRFAAKILARLGATKKEVAAALESMLAAKQSESRSHPSPLERINITNEAWTNEKQRLIRAKLATEDLSKKYPLRIDESAFKNPWNLVSDAKAEIDGEKISFYLSLPKSEINRDYKVCIFSSSPEVSPGRNSSSISSINLDSTYTSFDLDFANRVTWNFTMDDYNMNEVQSDKSIRLYVFDTKNLPTPPKKSGIIWMTTSFVIGATSLSYGLVEIVEGKNQYDNTYLITRNDEDFKSADSRYVQGQYFAIGGGLLIANGLRMVFRRSKRKKAFNRSQCSSVKKVKINTYASISNIGFNLMF